ncbi:MAG: DNA primase [Candidatus Colwellbacteria bacterium]|nr:DNA primase [Candidatus Colwellbacteria bacterium]
MQQPSEQIKSKLDIVDVLKDYIELRAAGRNFKANCPFHQEKTPSFIISRDRQIWHCFGCGQGGDIFKFVMEYENIEFYEALKILAEKAGVELKSLSYENHRQFGVLYEINEAAKNFYIDSLRRSDPAKNYLKSRKLTGEVAAEFELGFSPDMFDGTTAHLLKKGFSKDDIVRAGIAYKTDGGRVGDRFKGRIMFPIHNHFGKIVGFTGRVLPQNDTGEMGKYVNSPESPIFNKSKVLYGFWKSKRDIRENGVAILVEGQMDFLSLWSAGVKNAGAASGTALTPEHLKALRPIANKVILNFDNDEAGRTASERALDLLGEHDFSALVFDLKDYKDPAEAAEVDPQAVIPNKNNTRTAMQFYFDKYLKVIDNEVTNNKGNIRTILTKIQNLYSAIERAHWLKELSHIVGVREDDLREEMEKIKNNDVAIGNEIIKNEKTKTVLSRLDLISIRLLQLLYIDKNLQEKIERVLHFMPSDCRLAYSCIVKPGSSDAKVEHILDMISLRQEDKYEEEEFRQLLRELEVEYLRMQMGSIKRHIALIEAAGREEELAAKLKEFDELTKKLQDIRQS